MPHCDGNRQLAILLSIYWLAPYFSGCLAEDRCYAARVPWLAMICTTAKWQAARRVDLTVSLLTL